MTAEEENTLERCELVVFQCKELYIYKVPPASTIGHRAELWDLNHWLQEVSMKVVTQGEDCCISLFDLMTGKLFAECPIPKPDVAPLTTAVDPVVDSSRYFVLRLVDRTTARHAFLGIGFRERSHSSDFNAALSEHLQYVRRAREAERMRESFASAALDRQDGASPVSRSSDLTLKPGETLTLKLGRVRSRAAGASQRPLPAGSSPGADAGALTPPILPPPPGSGTKDQDAPEAGSGTKLPYSKSEHKPEESNTVLGSPNAECVHNQSSIGDRQDDWGVFVG